MSGSEWRPARLTPDQLEERRLAAAALLRQGQMTQAAIARHLGVSRASVCRWAAVLQEEGRRGLRARHREPGGRRASTPAPGRGSTGSWRAAQRQRALELSAGP
jgi:transposase-like protein